MSAQAFISNTSQTTLAAVGDGYSVPRMPTAQRLAIVFTTTDQGMMVYDTTLNNLFIWNGTAWASVPDSGDSTNEQVIFNDNGVLVGDPGLLFNKTTDKLTVATTIDIWRGLLNQGTSTGVGNDTLNITTVGANGNTAIGYRSASQLTSGLLNTGVGFLALKGAVGNFTGSGNVGVGANAGSSISSGSNNIAVGKNALLSVNLITGSENIGIGTSTLLALLNGADNIAIGRAAGTALTSGASNTYVGAGTAAGNLTGDTNTAIGFQALNLATVSDLVAVGANALVLNTTGLQNTAVGRSALATTVSTNNSTALGFNAGRSTTATQTTAIGANALGLAVSGDGNTAVGTNSIGNGIVTGFYNTAIGVGSGFAISGGSSNTFLGVDAGSNLTIGASNICIGRNSVTAGIADSNKLVLGSATYWVGTNGGASTYFPTAGAGAVIAPGTILGFIQVKLNGTLLKLAVYPD